MEKDKYTIWNNTVRRLSSLRNTILDGIKPLKHLTWQGEFVIVAAIVVILVFLAGLFIIRGMNRARYAKVQEILKEVKVVDPNAKPLWKSYGDIIMIYLDGNKILYIDPKYLKEVRHSYDGSELKLTLGKSSDEKEYTMNCKNMAEFKRTIETILTVRKEVLNK